MPKECKLLDAIENIFIKQATCSLPKSRGCFVQLTCDTMPKNGDSQYIQSLSTC